jgi:hypothetical protein
VTTSATDWHHHHATGYAGAVWVLITPDPLTDGAAHRVTLRWGPDLRRLDLPALGPGPLSLVHRKTPGDRGVLLVEVEPAATVAFGEGPPPQAPAVDVADGWIRSAGGRERAVAPLVAREPGPQYHVRLHRLMGNAEDFNLTREDVVERFVLPWRSGHTVTLEGRLWSPARTRLIIYAGPPLTTNQRALGQGWVNVMKLGEDVTEELIRAG